MKKLDNIEPGTIIEMLTETLRGVKRYLYSLEDRLYSESRAVDDMLDVVDTWNREREDKEEEA